MAEEVADGRLIRLLRDYEGDAHAEDVQDVIRWLAVYDSREQRATDSAPDCTCQDDPGGGVPVMCPTCRKAFNTHMDEIVDRVLAGAAERRRDDGIESQGDDR